MKQSRHAVVLTGTGANAAFEAGVLQGLLCESWGVGKNEPIVPLCYSGTSSGAFNAAAMVSMAHLPPAESLRRLEDIWVKRIAVSSGGATGLFRIRWDPTQYFQPRYSNEPFRPWLDLALDSLHGAVQIAQRTVLAASSSRSLPDGIVQLGEFCEILDISPLRRLIADEIDAWQIAANRECKLRVTAVDWHNGTPRTFVNSDFANAWGNNILVAAQALPGVVAPETVDGLRYVDSCVLFDKPLQPAIDAGLAEGSDIPLVLHAIYVDCGKRDIPVPAFSNTFNSLYRLYMLALGRAILSDIARAGAVNQRLWMKELLQTVMDASPAGEPDASEELAFGGLRRKADRDLDGRKMLTIHRYTPKGHTYGFELRQFERDSIQQLIRHGSESVLSHMWVEAG